MHCNSVVRPPCFVSCSVIPFDVAFDRDGLDTPSAFKSLITVQDCSQCVVNLYSCIIICGIFIFCFLVACRDVQHTCVFGFCFNIIIGLLFTCYESLTFILAITKIVYRL